jgi:hypothetical protein
MLMPMVAADCYSYNENYIKNWMRVKGDNADSPKTGEKLAHNVLVPI